MIGKVKIDKLDQLVSEYVRRREEQKPRRQDAATSLTTSEGDLKRTVNDYLTLKMNQHKLYFDRLNSGEIIALAGESRRRITLCRPGTADFFVLMSGRLIFLELKSPTGQQEKEQKLFEAMVTWQGAEYYIIRELEELQEIIEHGNVVNVNQIIHMQRGFGQPTKLVAQGDHWQFLTPCFITWRRAN